MTQEKKPMTKSEFLSQFPTTMHLEGETYPDRRVVKLDGKVLRPGPSLKVFNHSPDGFNWGYSGSGPAQLALAILMEFTDNDTAVEYHQNLKYELISGIKGEYFARYVNMRQIMESLYEKRQRFLHTHKNDPI